MGEVATGVTNALFGRAEQPDLPEATIPAAPAPSRREDTGAKVVVGTDAVKDARSSGRASGGGTTKTRDVIGGLGAGGLSI